jgi:hypothetical protein
MKKFFILVILFLKIVTYSQSPDFNLQKYWFYRERFNQFFVSVGTNPGQSIAIPARSTNETCKANQVVNYDEMSNYQKSNYSNL